MKRPSLRTFIKENRQIIDCIISKMCGNVGPLNDTDRAQWIANDEGLYNWVKSQTTWRG